MHPYLNIAIRAARAAGRVITRYMDQLDSLKIQEKGLNDLVTLVDETAEQKIIEIIQKAYPNHAILGEETGSHLGHLGRDDYTWIIDPLDGTMNYTHGFPQFAVSIGIRFKDRLEHGVVYDPISQDLYTATRGRGAQLNDRRLRVSNRASLSGALIGTSFPFREETVSLDAHIEVFKAVAKGHADIRRTGSAALNLAYIAAGRLDGFWESDLKEWDMAAGALLVMEAGGYVSDFLGEAKFLENGQIIAGNKKIYMELLKTIEGCKSKIFLQQT